MSMALQRHAGYLPRDMGRQMYLMKYRPPRRGSHISITKGRKGYLEMTVSSTATYLINAGATRLNSTVAGLFHKLISAKFTSALNVST